MSLVIISLHIIFSSSSRIPDIVATFTGNLAAVKTGQDRTGETSHSFPSSHGRTGQSGSEHR